MKNFFIILIRIYQLILSPFMYPRCRFYPSCSHYGILALQEWGLIKGGILLLKRLIRCQPFAKSGIDFVPKKVLKR